MLSSHRGLLVLLLLPALACAGPGGDSGSGQGPMVVTSIFPVGDLVERMVGESARVEVLLPPGASPATFEVTPRQVRELHGADLFIMIGGGLDEWVAQLPEASGGRASVVRLSDGIPLLAEGGEHGSGNPHIWLDPILVRDRMLPKLEAALEAVLPADSSALGRRTELLADSLTALDQEIRATLEPLRQRSFVATHPAWSYFAQRYGLKEVGVIHAHPGQEPSSRELARLLEIARDDGVDCIFVEPQLGEVAAKALATELSLPTCLLDPLGGPGLKDRDGYFQLLRFDTHQFVTGLEKGSG